MADLDTLLEDCLERLEQGESVAACLERYPEQAEALRPLLLAAIRIEKLQALQPSPKFRAEGRARLQAHMRSHPRQPVMLPEQEAAPQPAASIWQSLLARLRTALRASDRRLAYGLATLALIFLTAFTAAAQTALPGEPLYGWKLTSERVWRTFQGDKMAADLALLDRRAAEMIEVADDEARLAQARSAYEVVLARTLADATPVERAELATALRQQQQLFAALDVIIPALDELLAEEGLLPDPATPPPVVTPTPTGTMNPVGPINTITPLPSIEATPSPDLDGNLNGDLEPTAIPVLPSASAEPSPTPLAPLPSATVPDPLPTATETGFLPTVDPLPTVPAITPTLDLPAP